MTVSQIAGELGLTPQAIYHHIRKMKKAGLVDVSREERVGHFIETYYRSAAEIFQFSLGEGKSTYVSADRLKEVMDGLSKLGLITCIPDKEALSRIIEAMDSISRVRGGNGYLEKIAAADEADLFVRETMMEFAEMISLTDAQVKEQVRLRKELRSILLDCSCEKKERRKG